MAASKKNIDAFQKALMSNTKVISSTPRVKKPNVSKPKKTKSPEQIDIPEELKTRINHFAIQSGLDSKDVIRLALSNFLEFEDFWLSE